MSKRAPNKADERVEELIGLFLSDGPQAADRRYSEIIVEDNLSLAEQIVLSGRFQRDPRFANA